MREQRERQISVSDMPVEAGALFLDLLYSGMTEAEYEDGKIQPRRVAPNLCLIRVPPWFRPTHNTAIAALDLAHRWQVRLHARCTLHAARCSVLPLHLLSTPLLQCEAVTGMLERALAGLLTDASFEAVAEAAAEKCDDLQTLPSACKRFGLLSDEVRRKLKKQKFSQRVQEMCWPPKPEETSQSAGS